MSGDSTRASNTAVVAKMRLQVDIGKDKSSKRLLVPVDGSSTVAQLARSVEEREIKRRKTTGETPVKVAGIQLRVEDSLCEVDPDDVLSDLVPNDGQGAVFVALCREEGVEIPGVATTSSMSEPTSTYVSTPSPAPAPSAAGPASPSIADDVIIRGVRSLTAGMLPEMAGFTPPTTSNDASKTPEISTTSTSSPSHPALYPTSYFPVMSEETDGAIDVGKGHNTPSNSDRIGYGPRLGVGLAGAQGGMAAEKPGAFVASAQRESRGGGAVGRGRGRGRRRPREEEEASAAEGRVPSVLPGRATGMMASLMMGGDPLAKKAATAAAAAAVSGEGSGLSTSRSPALSTTPSGSQYGVAGPTLGSVIVHQQQHQHHSDSPTIPLLGQPWSPRAWHGVSVSTGISSSGATSEGTVSRVSTGGVHHHPLGADSRQRPPTEEEATAASRAAAAAMEAVKVQLMGPPWRAIEMPGGVAESGKSPPAAVAGVRASGVEDPSGSKRRPADQRAAAAAAAALAGLGTGQWGAANAEEYYARNPTLVKDLFPGMNFQAPSGIGPRTAPSTSSGIGGGKTEAVKLAAAAAAIKASVAEAFGRGAARCDSATAAAAVAAAAAAAAAAGATVNASSCNNDSDSTVHVDVGDTSPSPLASITLKASAATSTMGAVKKSGERADAIAPVYRPRYEPPVRQWQAAEKYIVNAFMLQENESAEKQEAAKIFFTKLAEKTGEPPGPVIALVRTAVQPAPWGSGYLVASRRQLTNLCQSAGTPMGFDCLTRLLLGKSFPSAGALKVDAPRIRKCFSALAAQIGNHPERGPLDYHSLGVGRCVFTLRDARVAALERAAAASSAVASGAAASAAAAAAAAAAAGRGLGVKFPTVIREAAPTSVAVVARVAAPGVATASPLPPPAAEPEIDVEAEEGGAGVASAASAVAPAAPAAAPASPAAALASPAAAPASPAAAPDSPATCTSRAAVAPTSPVAPVSRAASPAVAPAASISRAAAPAGATSSSTSSSIPSGTIAAAQAVSSALVVRSGPPMLPGFAAGGSDMVPEKGRVERECRGAMTSESNSNTQNESSTNTSKS